MNSFRILGGSFSVHTFPETLTKHNTKETASKGNIWGKFYIHKSEGEGKS